MTCPLFSGVHRNKIKNRPSELRANTFLNVRNNGKKVQMWNRRTNFKEIVPLRRINSNGLTFQGHRHYLKSDNLHVSAPLEMNAQFTY